MADQEAARVARIRELNDAFRSKLPAHGPVLCSAGVNHNGPEFIAKCIAAVTAFKAFNASNDPWHEHDLGAFSVEDEDLFWKIEYYDKRDLYLAAEDASDPGTTERVLFIMLREEY